MNCFFCNKEFNFLKSSLMMKIFVSTCTQCGAIFTFDGYTNAFFQASFFCMYNNTKFRCDINFISNKAEILGLKNGIWQDIIVLDDIKIINPMNFLKKIPTIITFQ